METRGGKILEYLKENSHLDLEVPDIAFNVKKSEKTVEVALQKLQQKGLVTARQNEYGRVYWYALPSAPATRTIKLEDVAPPKESSVQKIDKAADEVDVSDLQPQPVPVGRKSKKTVAEAAPSVKSKEATPPATVPAQPSVSFKPKGVKISESPGSPASPTMPKAPPAAITAPKIDPAPAEPDIEFAPKPASKDNGVAAPEPRLKSLSPIVIAMTIIALFCMIALVRTCGPTGKIKALEAQSKNFVTSTDFKTVKDQAAKITEAEAKIAALTAQVDSLKGVTRQLIDASKKPVLSKMPVSRGSVRKR